MISFLKNSQNLGKKLVIFALVSVIFTGVFCVVTWPWAANFSEKIPGLADEFLPEESMNYADTYQYLGNYRIYETNGFSWKLFDLSSRSNLALLQLLMGEMPGYNLWWFASFFIAFGGCFLLVWYLTKNYWGAFGAGLIFSLFSYHFAHSCGHSGAIWYGWLAFLVLFVLRYFQTKSNLDLLAGLFFFYLVARADDHYALYGAILILALVIYGLLTRQIKWNQVLRWPILAGLIIGAIVFFLFFGDKLQVYFSDTNWLVPPFVDVSHFSIELLAPLTPPSYHLIQGNAPLHSFNQDHYWSFPERTIYLGWSALFLATIGLWIQARRHELKKLALWIFLAVGFLILAYGTSLVIDRNVFVGLPLPYYFVYQYIPFFNIIRATGRIIVLSSIGWSVLAGYGISYLTERLNKWPRRLVGSGLILLLCLDLAYFNLPSGQPKVSEFYTRVLTADTSDSRILEIPASTDYGVGSMTGYYEKLSNHSKINWRDYSRTGRVDLSNIKNNPILNKLAYDIPTAEVTEIIKHDWPSLCPAVFRDQNIGYVALHRKYLSDEALRQESQLLEKCGGRLVFDDDEIMAYQTSEVASVPSFYLSVSEFSVDNREAPDSVLVHNPSDSLARVTIDFVYRSTTYQELKLNFEYAGSSISEFSIPGFEKGKNSLSFDAVPGDTALVIKYLSPDGVAPIETPQFIFPEINYTFSVLPEVAN